MEINIIKKYNNINTYNLDKINKRLLMNNSEIFKTQKIYFSDTNEIIKIFK